VQFDLGLAVWEQVRVEKEPVQAAKGQEPIGLEQALAEMELEPVGEDCLQAD